MMTLGDAGHIAGAMSIGMVCAYVWRRSVELWLDRHPDQATGLALCPHRGFKSFFGHDCPQPSTRAEDDTAALRRGRL